MSNTGVESEPSDEPSVGFLVGQGLLLLTAQVVASRLLPTGLDPNLAAAPWLLVAVVHGVLLKPRLAAPLHYVVVVITAVAAAAFEVAAGLDDHGHGAAAGTVLAVDVALYTGIVSAVGVWAGRAIRPLR